jgi:hypothetical protein
LSARKNGGEFSQTTIVRRQAIGTEKYAARVRCAVLRRKWYGKNVKSSAATNESGRDTPK